MHSGTVSVESAARVAMASCINPKQTNQARVSHTSCTNSQQSTVVTMDGVTVAVSHPELLKSLQPLSVIELGPKPDFDMESNDSMDDIDAWTVESTDYGCHFWLGHK